MAAETSLVPNPKKKKKSPQQMQDELRELSRPSAGGDGTPKVDLKKIGTRVALIIGVIWAVAFVIPTWIPKAIAGALTLAAIGAGFWLKGYLKKTQALGAILRGADTVDGRKEALRQLETDFKKDDVQAAMARAQLEMQEDPRKAMGTLEAIDLKKQLGPVADQIRSMRAMLHLNFGETDEARKLVDVMEIGKQEEPKTRAMFATIAGETWGRTGDAKKAIDLLTLFDPDDPMFAELRVQMWRARAFAYAGANDMKAVERSLKKLAEVNPQLLGMFITTKRVHPVLQHQAKQLLQRSGAVPRKMVRQRM